MARFGDVLPGMNAGASLSAVPSPIEGSGTAWVLLGSWALSPARPTPIPPRHECRGFSALLVKRPLSVVSSKKRGTSVDGFRLLLKYPKQHRSQNIAKKCCQEYPQHL